MGPSKNKEEKLPKKDPSSFARAGVDRRARKPKERMTAPIRLRPTFQHYAWGDSRFIPALTGVENPDGRPFAEMWLGAHSSSPSMVEMNGREIGLDRLLSEKGEDILGPPLHRRFGGLPYLFKILSVDRPLSIQVHPDRKQAGRGFARENAARIRIDSVRRCYKDDNCKPELVVALSSFCALLGFRPLKEIEAFLKQTSELKPLATGFTATSAGLRGLCRKIMEPEEGVQTALSAFLKRLRRDRRKRPFSERESFYWMLKADSEFWRHGRPDPGVFLIPLLNLVLLRPGQGLFVDAGVVHAHLSGAAVEIMANSDNVVRCGLTPKHVDLEEFLRIARFSGEAPVMVEPSPKRAADQIYRTEAREFELRRRRLGGSDRVHADPGERAALLFVLKADEPVALTAAGKRETLGPGSAWLMPRGLRWTVKAAGEAVIFVASTPCPDASRTGSPSSESGADKGDAEAAECGRIYGKQY